MNRKEPLPIMNAYVHAFHSRLFGVLGAGEHGRRASPILGGAT